MQQNKQVIVEKLYQNALNAMREKQPKEAQKHLEQALKEDIGQVNLWHLLADAHLASGDTANAISVLTSASAYKTLTPEDRISLQIHLASIYVHNDNLGAAVKTLDINAIIALKNPKLAARAGYLLALCEEHKSAFTVLNSALYLQPNNAELLFNTAAAHRAMGEITSAESMYDRVIKLSPTTYPAYWLRSSLRKQTKTKNHIHELRKAISQNINPKGRIHLYYSLAKELEDLGSYKESFITLTKGANLKKQAIKYSVINDLSAIEKIQETYNSTTIEKLSNQENTNGKGIIFILGMPRTGSTLVDRIISSKDEVYSAGEPNTLARIFYQASMQAAGIKSLNNSLQIEAIEKSLDIDFYNYGKLYQENLLSRKKDENITHIIDKNPINFLFLGFIKLALPKAKIIHIRRDPMDTCYAIFKTLFQKGHPYSYDLLDLGNYYIAYNNLMNHWKSIFGSDYLELHYEDLVSEPQTTSKAILKYCNLTWTKKCLDFHKNTTKGTATASAAQVRQPIYRSSIGIWKNYEKELTLIKQLLTEKSIA